MTDSHSIGQWPGRMDTCPECNHDHYPEEMCPREPCDLGEDCEECAKWA